MLREVKGRRWGRDDWGKGRKEDKEERAMKPIYPELFTA
jgi:hypothetical protein